MTMITTDKPVRVQVRYHSGRGHVERCRTMADAVAWLASPAFLTLEHAVRSVEIVAPHPRYLPDPEHATPRPRKALPAYLAHGLPRSMTA